MDGGAGKLDAGVGAALDGSLGGKGSGASLEELQEAKPFAGWFGGQSPPKAYKKQGGRKNLSEERRFLMRAALGYLLWARLAHLGRAKQFRRAPLAHADHPARVACLSCTPSACQSAPKNRGQSPFYRATARCGCFASRFAKHTQDWGSHFCAAKIRRGVAPASKALCAPKPGKRLRLLQLLQGSFASLYPPYSLTSPPCPPKIPPSAPCSAPTKPR